MDHCLQETGQTQNCHWTLLFSAVSLCLKHYHILLLIYNPTPALFLRGDHVSVILPPSALVIKTGTISGTMISTENQFQSIPYRSPVCGRTVLLTVI
jgi:hypothetical protein